MVQTRTGYALPKSGSNTRVLRDVTNKNPAANSGPVKPGHLNNLPPSRQAANNNFNNLKRTVPKSAGAFGTRTLKAGLPDTTGSRSLRRRREDAGLEQSGQRQIKKTRATPSNQDINNTENNTNNSSTNETAILPVDKKNGKDNDLYPMEYVRDIFKMLKKTATKYQCDPDYMTTTQTEICGKMRAILVDWLVDLHRHFDMSPLALHLTVNLVDRFLSKEWVRQGELQLAGSVALLIASKYEDIYPPEISEFEQMTAHTYSTQQIIDFEIKMLTTLDFNITVPTGLIYLDRFLTLFDVEAHSDAWRVAHYLMELGLGSYSLIRHTAAKQAAGVVFIVLRSGLVTNMVDKNSWMSFLKDNFPPQKHIIVRRDENRMFWDRHKGKALTLHDEIKLISQEYLYQVAKLKRSKCQATFKKWAANKPPYQNASEHQVLQAVIRDPQMEKHAKQKIEW